MPLPYTLPFTFDFTGPAPDDERTCQVAASYRLQQVQANNRVFVVPDNE